MACGSPLDDPVAIGSTKVRFVNRATFTADRYRNSDGVESYLRVKGEVDFKSGLATGLAAAYVNPAPADPPDSECSTLGWADWKAARHRRAAAKPHRIAGAENTDADDGAFDAFAFERRVKGSRNIRITEIGFPTARMAG